MKPTARARAKGSKPAASKAGAGAPAAASGGIDPALIRQIAEVLDGAALTEIEVQFESLRIRVARQTAAVTQFVQGAQASPVVMAAPAAPAPAAPSAALSAGPAADNPGLIKSPMVGTVYRRPNPDSRPFIEVGSAVKAGERILLVEAMKTFNDIVAPRAGTVTGIFVEDGQPVEYDQPLVTVE